MRRGPPPASCGCQSIRAEDVPDPEPLDAANQPPIDRYCDLVLTGGVTDGVIYPWAILELARAYRFKNIGGTSVGAMAAAITAAAEYARRQGFLSGFNDVVLTMPRKLGEDVKEKGRTRIFTLFQPSSANQRLFKLFLAIFTPGGLKSTTKSSATCPCVTTTSSAVDDASAIDKFVNLVRPVLQIYWRPALWGLVWGLSPAIVGAGSLLFALSESTLTLSVLGDIAVPTIAIVFLLLTLAGILILVLAFILFEFYRDLKNGLVPNGFGLCTGGHAAGVPNDEPSLVEWLHEGIQAAARKTLDQPLTFRDLWEAPGGPIQARTPAATRTQKTRSIDLRMVTTNLTLGRPFGLPLDDGTSRLFFKVKDLKPFFPETVLNHLVRHSKRYSPAGPQDPPPSRRTRQILELPVADLPIVIAARLSLSFPVLFSAVPLWTIDYEPKRKARKVRRCRFSDGGICSNFPIHLFDAAIPKWPTFGISITARSIYRQEPFVWLPRLHNQGRGDCWNRFDDQVALTAHKEVPPTTRKEVPPTTRKKVPPTTRKKVPPLSRLSQFLQSIVFSGKDWDDDTAMRMPGTRDRIVRIYRKEEEGGLNLKITGDQIMDFASRYGQPAGRALVDKFSDRSDINRPSAGWNEHRWVRFNTFLVGMRERIGSLKAAAETAAYCEPISQQILDATIERPLSGSDPAGIPLKGPQARDLGHLLAALEEVESAFGQATMPQPYKPQPPPSLHLRPPL
jgi:predicted acylesterase/phospholipase RssA